jgi:predicted MPP superfamily phosphohydrolase
MTDAEDVLTYSWFHKVMVFFHWPTGWRDWQVLMAAALLAVVAGSTWWLATRNASLAIAVTIGQFSLMMGDVAILQALPRLGISFGPWKAQFLPLALPRFLATAAFALAAVWLDAAWSLGLALLAQLLGTAALVWGSMVEPAQLQLTNLAVTTDRLPSGARPWRLLHISDIHLERLGRREKQLLQHVRELEPDAILLTGDYTNLSYNRDPQTHAQIRQLLSQLSAPHGVYATLGSMSVDLRDVVPPLLSGLPVTLLRCDWHPIGEGDSQIVVLGLDCTHHICRDGRRLETLAAEAPADVARILLYHSPELMPQATAHKLDLYLCGHTHGGQVRLPLAGALLTSSKLGRQYVMGLYRRGRTHLYVSRGVGLEGLSAPRVRFLCRPEITLITLTGTS